MTIQDHIKNIVKHAQDAQKDLMSGKGFESFIEAERKIEAKMNHLRKTVKEMAKIAGTNLIVGTELSFGVADGSAVYYITKVRKNDVVVEHVPIGDAYRFQGVYENAKGELCLPRPVAERQCRFASAMTSMFG